jgi:ribonuclease P protein component
MLPRANRLQRSPDFQRVYRRGGSWALPLLALHILPQPAGKRVGISVSKKVGKAVGRNLVRRRLREAVRAVITEWKDGCDVVLVARSAAATASFSELETSLRELSQRAHLPRDPEADPATPYALPGRGPGGQPRRGERGSA